MQTTFVTGGTGLIGGEVVLALLRQRHPVRALVRAQSIEHARFRIRDRLRKSAGFDPRLLELLEVVPGDSGQEAFGCDPAAGDGVDTIIHCAANTSFSERERDAIWRTNVGGAEHLVDFTRRAAPNARVVFVSTASVVTAPRGCVCEDAPFDGHANPYTRSKQHAEAIAAASGLDLVIVRPSIVLSRGVDDRTMARSILWALPIMNEIGSVPIEPSARVDVVPVDFVADAIVRIAFARGLRSRLLHISAGRQSHSFEEIVAEIAQTLPQYERLRMTGANGPRPRARRHLFGPIEAYLPFINADVQYANDRLVAELGDAGQAPASISYIPELLELITLEEAEAEMARP